jgi:peroxiredoxin/predicted 2-oxoglutarate/Fe(II)-dependent dioxygenase YbiX
VCFKLKLVSEAFLAVGEPAPWFIVPATNNPQYRFNAAAGRSIVLCFFASAGEESSQQILDEFLRYRQVFDDDRRSFFGVSVDPEDERLSRVRQQIPGIRFFWDFDRRVSQEYKAFDRSGLYRRCTYILDERLRVFGVFSFDEEPETHVSQVLTRLWELPELPPPVMASVQAPILVVPRVFEPQLCQTLIDYYNKNGGGESGFMREVDGRTVPILDNNFKRRQDCEIEDEELRNTAMFRVHDRLTPEILKAFQFQATRIERHIVACYDSISGGFFRAHRDNTTKGTAHRKFAVSLNLNTGEYDGGCLRFPEFGRQTYEAPPGGAVVFSCSLLHEATPVTRGRRYAYLPFLYDEAAAKIRQANLQFLDNE